MADSRIQCLPESEAIEQIVETVQQGDSGVAPFALVLGSGFSHGLVPTARELVTESLPLWMKSGLGGEPYEQLCQRPADQRGAIAREFWKQFVGRNGHRELALALDPETGVPVDFAAAYKSVFSPRYRGAVGEPAQARKFQRALMRLDQARLNAAHFLLASLLGVQPGRSRPSDLFKARAAFSRLILTTNFDPFLQTALQAVNRLYFMSDTPELGVGDDILDDQTDAIHLVYLHGSIHRRSQAATDDDIRILKDLNARTLAPVLERHGVIVLGYSGWDDAIVEALAACDRFDHRLYWCGRETDPLAPGAFGPRVPEILRKPSALYVPINSAGRFMVQLCNQLVEGLPRLLGNPIGQIREMLQTIDLTELEPPPAPAGTGPASPQMLDGRGNTDALVKGKRDAIERLAEAEIIFRGGTAALPAAAGAMSGREMRSAIVAAEAENLKTQARRLLSSAHMAEGLGNYAESLKLCTEALGLGSLDVGERAGLLVAKGAACYYLGRMDEALADWTQVTTLPGAPVDQVAKALVNRGVTLGQQGETDRELADYTRVIENLPGAPVDKVAQALYNRGVTWGQRGETANELADYTRVIENLPGAPVDQVARALYNRGVKWRQQGETDKALADYTRVIENLPGAPVELVAKALANRGWNNYLRGQFSAFLADTEAALGKQAVLTSGSFNRGLALLACNRDADALIAYQRAGEQFPTQIDVLALEDLTEAQKTWLSRERAGPVVQLLQSLKK